LFDSGGEPRLVVTRREQKLAVHWRGLGQNAKQSDWQLLAEGDLLNMPFTPSFVDDLGNLFVTHQHGPEGLEVLSRFDFQRLAPAREPWVVTPGFDFSGTVLGGRRGAMAAGVRVDTELESTVWLDPKMKALQATADSKLPGRVNRLSCRRCGEADMVALVQSWSDIDPGQLFLYRAALDQWQRVSRVLEGSFWVNDDISGTGRRHTLPEMVGDAKADAEMLSAVPAAHAARRSVLLRNSATTASVNPITTNETTVVTVPSA
jgi:hypothetical protein